MPASKPMTQCEHIGYRLRAGSILCRSLQLAIGLSQADSRLRTAVAMPSLNNVLDTSIHLCLAWRINCSSLRVSCMKHTTRDNPHTFLLKWPPGGFSSHSWQLAFVVYACFAVMCLWCT